MWPSMDLSLPFTLKRFVIHFDSKKLLLLKSNTSFFLSLLLSSVTAYPNTDHTAQDTKTLLNFLG